MSSGKRESLNYSDIAQTLMRNVTGLVNHGPCILYDVLMSADGANADCDLYDGDGTNDERKFHVETLSGTSISWNSKRGTLFRKGLYIVVNAATTFVSVTFVPFEYEGKQGE